MSPCPRALPEQALQAFRVRVLRAPRPDRKSLLPRQLPNYLRGISVIMLLFANPVGKFVQEHPTIQMLGLSFLILIGFMLIAEGMHLAHASVFGSEVGVVPKGYLYFAIAFSLLVEFLNMKMKKNKGGKAVAQ